MCDLGRCQLFTYYLLTSPNKHFLTASCAPNMRDVCVFECLCVSRSVTSNSLPPRGLQPARLLYSWNSSGKNTGVGTHSFLQGIAPTQGLNLGLQHCRQILYHLSHQGTINRGLNANAISPLQIYYICMCAYGLLWWLRW